MRRERILIIDDDPDIRDVLDLSLSEHYTVLAASNGKEGLEMVKAKNPDLIITDYNMPVMNGAEFCRQLRRDILLRHLPVIMLTGKGETRDMVTGIESGADDYLVKPFEPETLVARIKMILKRTSRSLDANPLSHLPGNTSIMDELQGRIDSDKPFAVGYVDLDKFKVYNDKYGFEHGDEVIRALARILVEASQQFCGAEAFVGHIGGDDFVFICDDDKADRVSQSVIDAFDKLSPSFYKDDDRQAGFISGVDRQGNPIKAGLVSVSIGIVSNANQRITHVAQIGEIGAELKKFAKSMGKSNFQRDQRKG
ncbi:MAG: response regulator [Candidatus Omnitrophica bacterium]|nr:response regulator [Candidatus Omnitrophota bacterium]MDE2221785.1 response regulator [Candidatus Omnitrophota bacterium]